MGTKNYLNILTDLILRLLVAHNDRPPLKKYLKSSDGWTNFSIGFKTEANAMEHIVFENGRVKVVKLPYWTMPIPLCGLSMMGC